MRIHSVKIHNYKKYKDTELDFSRTTLLVGENGSGKTSILDALATILSVWLVNPPESYLTRSQKNIYAEDLRMTYDSSGERGVFKTHVPCVIYADVVIQNVGVSVIRHNMKGKATGTEAVDALKIIQKTYQQDLEGPTPLCPVLAYYGAGRAWIPSNERSKVKARLNGASRRWDAFEGALEDRIRFSDLQTWFLKEAIQAVRLGHPRPGFEVVKHAILRCIPQAQDIWFDTDMDQLVLSIGGNPQPFRNLSAGQRMMLSMVADLAIRAVQQNNHLVPMTRDHDKTFLLNGPGETSYVGSSFSHIETISDKDTLPRVLRETPGVVLIDEIDAHLHPRWQRSVLGSLRDTFPNLQFIATSHSPQVIGELTRDEVWILDGDTFRRPSVALGADSNWILDHVISGARSQNKEAQDLQRATEDALERNDLDDARASLGKLKALLQGDTATSVQLEAALLTLESLADDGAEG